MGDEIPATPDTRVVHTNGIRTKVSFLAVS